MPANIHGGWKTCGDPRSLADRFEEKLNELAVVAPSVCYGSPRTELTLVELTALVEKFRVAKAPPERDRYFVAALRELSDEESGHDREWLQLRDGQHELARLANRWDHQLLGWPADGDLFVIPGRIDIAPGAHDIYTTEAEVKARTEEVKQLRVKMQARLRRISDIMYYQNALPPPDQEVKARMRDEALFKRVLALEAQLIAKPKSKKAA